MNPEELEAAYQKMVAAKPELKTLSPDVVKSTITKIRSKIDANKNKSIVPETPTYKPTWDMQRDTRRADALAKSKAGQEEIDNDWKNDVEAGFLGTVQGLSGDIMPTLKGAYSASPIGRIQRKVNEYAGVEDSPYSPGPSVNTGKGLWEDTKAQYLQDRDALLNRDKELQQRALYHAGHGVGEVAQMAIPGGAGAKGVKLSKVALTSGLVGGTQSALSDATTTEGEFKSLPQLAGEFVEGGAKSAALGGAVGYLGAKAVSKPTPKKPGRGIGGVIEDTGTMLEQGIKKTVGGKLKEFGKNLNKGKEHQLPEQSTPRATESVTPDAISEYNTGKELDFYPKEVLETNPDLPNYPEYPVYFKDYKMSPEELNSFVNNKTAPKRENPVITSDKGFESGVEGSSKYYDPRGFDDIRDVEDIKSKADRPSALAKRNQPPSLKMDFELPEDLPGPKTDVDNPVINDLKNLSQFRNEFRGESKGMNPEDLASAFTPDRRNAVAEAGMEIGKFGDKAVKELGGEIPAARFLLDEGHAQSVDDLVKMLGMKGQGARADAKNIAKELGYPDLPTYAEGSSRARKKSVADKAKVDKKKK